MNSCTLTAVYFSILQHKLVFLLQHWICRDSFSVGVVRIVKVKWLEGNLTAFTVIQLILLVSTTINRTLIHSQSLLSVT